MCDLFSILFDSLFCYVVVLLFANAVLGVSRGRA